MTPQEITLALADIHTAIEAPKTLKEVHAMWQDLIYSTLSDLVALYEINISISAGCRKLVNTSAVIEVWYFTIRFRIDYEDNGVFEEIPVCLYSKASSLDEAERAIHEQLQQLVDQIHSRTVTPCTEDE